MSLRTIPPFRAGVLCGCGRVFRTCASDNRAETLSASLLERAGAHLPALLQGNPPSRVLRFSLLRCGEHPRGYPDVASGGYSYPALQLGASRGGAVSSEVTSGCPKRSEGGCPCRNEDEHQPLHAASHRNSNTAPEPASCRSCPAAHSREREPNAPRSAQLPASGQRRRQPRRCRCAPPARAPPNRQCR